MDGDLDNIAKPILDGLNGVVWSDDRQIARLTLRRVRRDADPPTVFADTPARVLEAIAASASNAEFIFVRAVPYAPEWRLP